MHLGLTRLQALMRGFHVASKIITDEIASVPLGGCHPFDDIGDGIVPFGVFQDDI
jgi:hypothetical protein